MFRFGRITLIMGLCSKLNVAGSDSGTDTLGIEHQFSCLILIELQIFDHYDAFCGRKAGIDDRDGGQNEHPAVDLYRC